jgi:hypothetical protein
MVDDSLRMSCLNPACVLQASENRYKPKLYPSKSFFRNFREMKEYLYSVTTKVGKRAITWYGTFFLNLLGTTGLTVVKKI